jgi:hypothetical protein
MCWRIDQDNIRRPNGLASPFRFSCSANKSFMSRYGSHAADRIVAERNNGGDMVEATIRMVNPNVPVTTVWASRGKIVSAEPVAALYEQNKIHPPVIDLMAALKRSLAREGTSEEPGARTTPKRRGSAADRRQAPLLLPLSGGRKRKQEVVAKTTTPTPGQRKKA